MKTNKIILLFFMGILYISLAESFISKQVYGNSTIVFRPFNTTTQDTSKYNWVGTVSGGAFVGKIREGSNALTNGSMNCDEITMASYGVNFTDSGAVIGDRYKTAN